MNYLQRKNRYITNVNIAFFVLPLVLLPLGIEYLLSLGKNQFFLKHQEDILLANIIYIVLARFALLDSAVYIFSHTKRSTHLALIQIVLLYLEITVITIVYYAIVFDIFDVFTLFHLSAALAPENLANIHKHTFVTSVYISAVTFTTLGSGDWLPQTLNAMIASTSEVLLGVVQGGVFVAIVIYAHQSKKSHV